MSLHVAVTKSSQWYDLDKAKAAIAKQTFGDRTPYKVQIDTMAWMISYSRGYNLNGLGTGKTFCTLAAFDLLRRLKRVSRLLVSCKQSTMTLVWVREILGYFPQYTTEVLYGTKQQRLDALERDADIYIINHDGVGTIYDDLMARPDIDALVIDEIATFRNGQAEWTKQHRALAAYRKSWVWGLTGSPMPKEVTDIWGQCSIINPGNVPRYFGHLRHQLMYKLGGNSFKWVARDGAVEQAVKMMQPSVRYSLDDVTELPEQVISYVPVDMGRKQAEVYKAMRTKSVALIKEDKIDALNAGAVLSKLLQIALGWVYTREGKTIKLDNEARVRTIISFIEETERKAIVFVPFKHALAGISAALTAAKIDHFTVSGDTKQSERNEIFGTFQDSVADRRPLIAHPACMAHGLTLTAADTIIWGAPVTSLEMFQQANARIRRIGQMHKQRIIMVGGTPIEKHIYNLLGDNEVTQNEFLALLSSVE